MAASSIALVSVSSGGSHLNKHQVWSTKSNMFPKTSTLAIPRKSNQFPTNRNLLVCAANRDDGGSSGGSDFLVGFLLGGAIFGTLAYTYAPQIRRAVLDENEHGFRRPKRPAYFDDYEGLGEGGLEEGLEKARQTLNAKVSQLSSAIDKISSRLRGNNKSASKVPSDAAEDDSAGLPPAYFI